MRRHLGILLGLILLGLGMASPLQASPSHIQESDHGVPAQATPWIDPDNGDDTSEAENTDEITESAVDVAESTVDPSLPDEFDPSFPAQAVTTVYSIAKSVSGDTIIQDGISTFVENGIVTYTVTVTGTLAAGVTLHVDDGRNGPAELVDPEQVQVTCNDGTSCGNLGSDADDVFFDISRSTDGPVSAVLTYDVEIMGEPMDTVQNLACVTTPGLSAQCAGVGLTILPTPTPIPGAPTPTPTAPPTETPATYTIAKTASDDTVVPGGTIGYTVTVAGTLAPDQVIDVSDELPGDTDLVVDSVSLGCVTGQCSQPNLDPGDVSFELGNPAGGAVEAVLFYEVVVRDDVEIGSLLVNAACGNGTDVPEHCAQVTVEVVRPPLGEEPTATAPVHTVTPVAPTASADTDTPTVTTTATPMNLAVVSDMPTHQAPPTVTGLPATGSGQQSGSATTVLTLLATAVFVLVLLTRRRPRRSG